MRKLILLMHTSLDNLVAGPNGEINWIHVDNEIFDRAKDFTDNADTALYGRVTYEMMESYWPNAGKSPNASKHDIEHSEWANSVPKIVFSRTMKTTSWKGTRIVSENISEEIKKLKQQPGKDMIMFGSAATANTLTQLGLIDEYRLFQNPVILGKGIPLFKNIQNKIDLTLLKTRTFSSGVVELHYGIKK